jgi:hypothetical protein
LNKTYIQEMLGRHLFIANGKKGDGTMSNKLKGGGDAINMAGAESSSGDADSAGVGVGTGVLGSLGLGAGFGGAETGDALTEQGQGAKGGDILDNTNIGDVNIDT